MQLIKAILIDPEKQEVSEIEIEPTYQAIKKAIDVDRIELVYISDRNYLVIDEEGLLKDNWFYSFKDGVLQGKTLVLSEGVKEEDCYLSPTVPIEIIKKNVKWKGFLREHEINVPAPVIQSFDTSEGFFDALMDRPPNPCDISEEIGERRGD